MSRYGHAHQRVRKALLPAAVGAPCLHCGETMRAGEPLDLDHTVDGSGYRGVVHSICNRREGGRRGNQAARGSPRSRDW